MKIWNQIFDKILVISLKECVDRRSHIEREFARVGIEQYEFFDASSPSSPEFREIVENPARIKRGPECFRCNRKRCNCENNYLTDFQIANWVSFIRVWQHIVDNNLQFVLVCEDDIVFTHQFQRIVFPLLTNRTFKHYGISTTKPLLIGLGGPYHPGKHLSKRPAHLKRQNVMCNASFCLNQAMARMFLEHFHIHNSSDHFMHVEFPQRFPIVQHYLMYPWAVYDLSFIPGVRKFDSLVRPKGMSRRKEYADYLIISPFFKSMPIGVSLQNGIQTDTCKLLEF